MEGPVLKNVDYIIRSQVWPYVRPKLIPVYICTTCLTNNKVCFGNGNNKIEKIQTN